MALEDDIQNANDLNESLKAFGPRKVINDDVEVTARSADELIKLMEYANRRKLSVKNRIRQIKFMKQRKPNANGD